MRSMVVGTVERMKTNPNIDAELIGSDFRIRNDNVAQTTYARIIGRIPDRDQTIFIVRNDVTYRANHSVSKRVSICRLKKGLVMSTFTFKLNHLSKVIDALEELEREIEEEQA